MNAAPEGSSQGSNAAPSAEGVVPCLRPNNSMEPTRPAGGYEVCDTGLGLAGRLISRPLGSLHWRRDA
jgi:hypothetical protein